MKITEKLYIDRLEEMVKRYKKNMCNHCPMSLDFDSSVGVFIDDDIADYSLSCRICEDLHSKYITITPYRVNRLCPCNCFNKDGKTDMITIAWKVIHEWRKDNRGNAI